MIRWFLRWLAGTEDPTWKPTGIEYRFEGHDEKLGRAGYLRSLKRTATGKTISKPKAKKPADILPMRRRAR